MSATELDTREAAYVEWSRWFFDHLADGGEWFVPAAGQIYERHGDELVLVVSMPYLPEMGEAGISEDEHREAQAEMFRQIEHWFGLAGVEVRRTTRDARRNPHLERGAVVRVRRPARLVPGDASLLA